MEDFLKETLLIKVLLTRSEEKYEKYSSFLKERILLTTAFRFFHSQNFHIESFDLVNLPLRRLALLVDIFAHFFFDTNLFLNNDLKE